MNVVLLVLKVKEGATSQGMQAASKSWQRPGDRFSARDSRKEHSLPCTLILTHLLPTTPSLTSNL